jgi:hypothetical protein
VLGVEGRERALWDEVVRLTDENDRLQSGVGKLESEQASGGAVLARGAELGFGPVGTPVRGAARPAWSWRGAGGG